MSFGSAWLLGRRCVHFPRDHIGLRLTFADGTSAPVFRETVVGSDVQDPCVLVVQFRLRFVSGFGHAVFRWESLLNTPLFVGFSGFVTKLWLAHDERGTYRGVYDWDGAEKAHYYARCLYWVLALVCPANSIHYRVLPGFRRRGFLPKSPRTDVAGTTDEWWRVIASDSPKQPARV